MNLAIAFKSELQKVVHVLGTLAEESMRSAKGCRENDYANGMIYGVEVLSDRCSGFNDFDELAVYLAGWSSSWAEIAHQGVISDRSKQATLGQLKVIELALAHLRLKKQLDNYLCKAKLEASLSIQNSDEEINKQYNRGLIEAIAEVQDCTDDLVFFSAKALVDRLADFGQKFRENLDSARTDYDKHFFRGKYSFINFAILEGWED